MDFVTKTALDAHLKKVTKPFKSSSDSHITSAWAAFTNRSPVKPQDSDVEAKAFHDDTECAFDESPKNFPPLLNLCYIDKSILSDAAVVPVTWASRIFFWFIVLLFFNTAAAFLLIFLENGSGWLRFFISVIATLLLSVYQLIVYETAFRGAYRTSMNLRKRYILFSAMNIPLILIYAIVSVPFFSGWIGMRKFDTEVNAMKLLLRRALVIVHFLGWTALLFASTYTLFEYYQLCKSGAQGLSSAALEAALTANQGREKKSRLEHGGNEDTNRTKIQEIRDRYNIQ